MRRDLPDIIADLYHRIADLERRLQNARRTGTVTEVDHVKGLARVKLGEDPATGKPYISAWVPWKMAAMGATKINVPPSVGQQVDVVSESGDLTDAMIDHALRSNDNPLPAAEPGQGVIVTGTTRIFFSPDRIEMRADQIRLVAGRIDMDEG